MKKYRPFFRRRRHAEAFTLVEMMVSLGIFALCTLGIWETIRTVFFLSAKNTGVNVSHTALQIGVDRLAEQLRSSLQIVDVANFDGTTFTDINEAIASGASAAGNAVRFLRVLPVTVYMLPDDGSGPEIADATIVALQAAANAFDLVGQQGLHS